MEGLLWIIAVILVIAGIVTLIRGGLLAGIALIVVGLHRRPRRREHLYLGAHSGSPE